MTLKQLGLGVLLGLPLVFGAPAGAADGDHISSTTCGSSGRYSCVDFFLCDGATGGATKTCSEFNLLTQAFGIPDRMVAEIDAETGCSGTPDVEIRYRFESGGTAHEYTGTALASAGDSAVSISQVLGPIVDASVADGTACTDLEVHLRLFYLRSAGN